MTLQQAVERIAEIKKQIAIAIAAPDAARKELSSAVIGHKDWNGYGLREVSSKALHAKAVEAVTDYIVDDLTDRKRELVRDLAGELDRLSATLPELARAERFALLDNIVSARNWAGGKQ